jgi:hypothetical protein
MKHSAQKRDDWNGIEFPLPMNLKRNVYLSNKSMILTDLASANDTTRLPAINHKDTYFTTVRNCCHCDMHLL